MNLFGRRATLDDRPAPPLTWRVWLLLPLVAIALLGIAVPIAVPLTHETAPVDTRRARYDGELLLVLEREDLPPEVASELARKHRELEAEAARSEGTIPMKERERVDQILERYAR